MVPLLNNFTPELSQTLIKEGHEKTFVAGDQVFAEGEVANFLPIILEGGVKMVRFPEVGKEIIIGVFHSGEIFAIPPALDGSRFPATAIATMESKILLLPRKKFLSVMEVSTEFSSVIMARMCGLLRDRTETVEILAKPSAERRVASVLIRLSDDEIKANGARTIQHKRQDIAEMSGLTPETTIRAIRKLADKGLIKIVRGKIVIESTQPLREFVR